MTNVEMRAENPPNLVEEMQMAAQMIRTWIPVSFPANADGKVHFVRAAMECVADVIERAAPATDDLLTALQGLLPFCPTASMIAGPELAAWQAAIAAIAKAAGQDAAA